MQIKSARIYLNVITNQHDIRRSFPYSDVLSAGRHLLQNQCDIDGTYVCPHDNSLIPIAVNHRLGRSSKPHLTFQLI
jgi:hypothetical protein